MLPSDLQLAITSQVLGSCENQHQTHTSPRVSQAAVQQGNQPLKTVSKRMPVNHPHLKNPAARNEPNAKRCALCELTPPAKNKDGFVVVEKVGEDACHGRYLVVFGRASVLKGSVLVACQRVGNVVPYNSPEATPRSTITSQSSHSMTACACGARMSNPPQPCGAQCRGSMPLEPMPMLLDKEAARQAALNAECIKLMLLDTPDMPQFDTLNKDLLKAWCKHKNIRGVSSKSKNELRDMCLLKLRKKVEAPRHM
ncbi:hypothetical protein QJQ45_021091 [Haematococcus lacustris]|nr:hypothetical protein QJQ45_021091 [Haematococcus lacustris]